MKEPRTLPRGYVPARDGLPARNQGDWAQQKLQFLRVYQGPALGATLKKGEHVYYLDLFAGPGCNVTRVQETGRFIESPGSPIQALRSSWKGKDGRERHFNGFFFCNIAQRDHLALQGRVRDEIAKHGEALSADQVHCLAGDANALLPEILAQIPTWAYLLVFADIEGPGDLAFSTLQRLKRDHQSVDLYVLYPSLSGMCRLLSYRRAETERHAGTLDRYFGTSEWKGIWKNRITNTQSKEMQLGLLDLYRRQLGLLWRHVDAGPQVHMRTRRLYRMLFAYDHAAAGNIARSASARAEQRELLMDDQES